MAEGLDTQVGGKDRSTFLTRLTQEKKVFGGLQEQLKDENLIKSVDNAIAQILKRIPEANKTPLNFLMETGIWVKEQMAFNLTSENLSLKEAIRQKKGVCAQLAGFTALIVNRAQQNKLIPIDGEVKADLIGVFPSKGKENHVLVRYFTSGSYEGDKGQRLFLDQTFFQDPTLAHNLFKSLPDWAEAVNYDPAHLDKFFKIADSASLTIEP